MRKPTIWMCVTRRLTCADLGFFVRGFQAWRPENSLNNVVFFCFCFFSFSLQLILQFTDWGPVFYYRENYTFSKDPEGVQHFQGGGGGPNAYFYKNPYNLWFSRGSGPPIPPLVPHMTQISLGNISVWSESLLSTVWILCYPLSTQQRLGSDWSVIWVFAGCWLILLALSCHGSFIHIPLDKHNFWA